MSTAAGSSRVIRTLPLELLPDRVADHMIQHGRALHKHKSSLGRNVPFHRPVAQTPLTTARQRYSVTVHDFLGEAHPSCFTEMFIAGSHRHPEFFRVVQQHLAKGLPHEGGQEPFPGLTLTWLNAVVTYLKTGVVEHVAALKAESWRQQLTPAQIAALPPRFAAFTLPMDQSFVLVADAQVLRRPCYGPSGAGTVRWKYVYHCVALETATDRPAANEPWISGATSASGTGALRQLARRYEADVAGASVPLVEPWPCRVTAPTPPPVAGLSALLGDALARYGVVCLPLAQDHIRQYTAEVAQYLGQLLRLPPSVSLADVNFVKTRLTHEAPDDDTAAGWLYRNKGQFCSRHIQTLTGRTWYGHYCPALQRLWQELNFLVASALAPHSDVWTLTAEIVLQY